MRDDFTCSVVGQLRELAAAIEWGDLMVDRFTITGEPGVTTITGEFRVTKNALKDDQEKA